MVCKDSFLLELLQISANYSKNISEIKVIHAKLHFFMNISHAIVAVIQSYLQVCSMKIIVDAISLLTATETR